MKTIDVKLKEWATPNQKTQIDAIIKHKGFIAAAKELGITRQALDNSMNGLIRRAKSVYGYSPEHGMNHGVPDGYYVDGISTYHKEERQWVKAKADKEKQIELTKIIIQEMLASVDGLSPIPKVIESTKNDLMVVYPIGDPHVGMQSWAKESGDNFDLKIARQLTLGAIDRLVSVAPAASVGILLPLGDIFHANDQSNRTPAHHHQLDVDSRHVKVLGVGIEIFKHAILRLLAKHPKVVVRFLRGNHDPEAVWVLAYALNAWFSNNPKVTIDLSPADQWYYKFGKVLIGATHGDRAKGSKLMGVMATDRAEDWGSTKHRYWLCGHVHHSSIEEFPGCTVETFRTLAAADAYSAGHGYRAGRDMRCIVYHKNFGEVERYRCDHSMILKGEKK